MSWYTDWFLAEESDAEAIASIGGSEEEDDDEEEGASFEDWPHLAMKSVGEMELMALSALLQGQPGGAAPFHDDGLYQEYDEDGGVAVTRVLPAFVDALAALSTEDVTRLAVQWHRSESMTDWEAADVAAVLGEIAEFVARAGRENKPVLQMTAW